MGLTYKEEDEQRMSYDKLEAMIYKQLRTVVRLQDLSMIEDFRADNFRRTGNGTDDNFLTQAECDETAKLTVLLNMFVCSSDIKRMTEVIVAGHVEDVSYKVYPLPTVPVPQEE